MTGSKESWKDWAPRPIWAPRKGKKKKNFEKEMDASKEKKKKG